MIRNIFIILIRFVIPLRRIQFIILYEIICIIHHINNLITHSIYYVFIYINRLVLVDNFYCLWFNKTICYKGEIIVYVLDLGGGHMIPSISPGDIIPHTEFLKYLSRASGREQNSPHKCLKNLWPIKTPSGWSVKCPQWGYPRPQKGVVIIRNPGSCVIITS